MGSGWSGISDKAGIYQLHCVGERERPDEAQAGHRLIMDVIIWSDPWTPRD